MYKCVFVFVKKLINLYVLLKYIYDGGKNLNRIKYCMNQVKYYMNRLKPYRASITGQDLVFGIYQSFLCKTGMIRLYMATTLKEITKTL